MIRKVCDRIRPLLYSFKFNIGKNCRFQKISIWDCERGTINIGDNVLIYRKTELCAQKDKTIKIGSGTFINQGCIIRANIQIGKNVSLGQRVSLISDTHNIGDASKRAGESIFLPIKIGDGCWIGANSTILGGVTIGEGTIIAAGAVVIEDCKPNSMYGGVPAKFIKSLQ